MVLLNNSSFNKRKWDFALQNPIFFVVIYKLVTNYHYKFVFKFYSKRIVSAGLILDIIWVGRVTINNNIVKEIITEATADNNNSTVEVLKSTWIYL